MLLQRPTLVQKPVGIPGRLHQNRRGRPLPILDGGVEFSFKLGSLILVWRFGPEVDQILYSRALPRQLEDTQNEGRRQISCDHLHSDFDDAGAHGSSLRSVCLPWEIRKILSFSESSIRAG
jgi:hypothetical protein